MLVFSFCLGSQSMAEVVGFPPFKAIGSYPFRASPERVDAIRRGQSHVVVGGTPSSVVAALGEPDEVMPLYEPKHNATKVIGYTYWYVIQRRVRSGSVLERQESALRIAFSLDHKVSAIDAWTDGDRTSAR